MRFRIAFLLLCSIPSLLANAQRYKAKRSFYFGTEGLSFSLSGFVSGENNYRLSAADFGILRRTYLKYSFNKQYTLLTGIGTDLKGASFHSNSMQNEIRLKYFTLLAMIQYAPLKNTPFFVSAGPYFSYLIKATLHENAGSSDQHLYNKTSSFNSTDGGLAIGFGFTSTQKNFYQGIEFRDQIGVVDVNTGKLLPGRKLFNQSFGVVLDFGIWF